MTTDQKPLEPGRAVLSAMIHYLRDIERLRLESKRLKAVRK